MVTKKFYLINLLIDSIEIGDGYSEGSQGISQSEEEIMTDVGDNSKIESEEEKENEESENEILEISIFFWKIILK